MSVIGINQGTAKTNLGLVNGYLVDAHVEDSRRGRYLYIKIDGEDPTGERGFSQMIAELEPSLVDQLYHALHETVSSSVVGSAEQATRRSRQGHPSRGMVKRSE